MKNNNFVVEGLLPTGRDHAISTKDLMNMVGCESARELQKYIAAERKAGAVILSSTSGGYYLPANRLEIREFCKSLEHRAINTLAALRSAKKALEDTEGQQTISLPGEE